MSSMMWLIRFCATIAAAGGTAISIAADAPIAADSRAINSDQAPTKDDSAKQAFSAAQAKIEQRRRIGLVDWRELATEATSLADKLVAEHGEMLAPLARDDGSETPLLSLLILDKLGQYGDAAQFVLRRQAKPGDVLVQASYCSADARLATADLLATRAPEHTMPFLVAVGGQHTLDTLKQLSPQPNETRFKRRLDRGIRELEARLSLPQERRKQYDQDALLFWQSSAGAPKTRVPNIGASIAAERLTQHHLSISAEFLNQQLERPQKPQEFNENKVGIDFALPIIASQKENASIPALVDLARRIPFTASEVKKTLQAIGTPQAQRAVQALSGGH